MTSLIGAGLGARSRAQRGFGAVAQLEARENRQMDLLDAAREQQEMSNLGTGAGFGVMYGMSKLPAAGATGTLASAGSTLGGTSAGTTVTGTQLGAGAGQLGGTIAPVGQTLGGTAAGSTAAGGGVAVAAPVSTTAAAGTGTTVAGGGAAAGGAGSALATLAMPIAIGLGAAFLINKLFD